MSIVNCVVYDSNGLHLAGKMKKEKDLTQREQSLAEGTEESCWGAPKHMHLIDGKGLRQEQRVSLMCEWGQRALPRTGSIRAACGGWKLARSRSGDAKGRGKIR